MAMDISFKYQDSIGLLKTWRDRYDRGTYPFKIILNMFYKLYGVNHIWNTAILPSFSKSHYAKTEWNYNESFQKIHQSYLDACPYYLGDKLVSLMNKKEDVGGLNYKHYEPLIEKAKNGSSEILEDLETTYIYYNLANEYIFAWASLGRLGVSMIDAIFEVTGSFAELPGSGDTKDYPYEILLETMGKVGVSAWLNKHYTPLSRY